MHKEVSTAQLNTILKTVTFPVTVTGMRWEFSVHTGSSDVPGFIHWAIVKVQEGDTANNLSTSDASTLYAPEENVLAFGTAALEPRASPSGPSTREWSGSTKTMRKLKAGDTLQWIAICNEADLATFRGVVQFFSKS